MKILQVISMGYVCGGAEKSVRLLQNGLVARGHEVRIMSSNRDPDVAHFSDYECQHISGPTGILRHLWNASAYKTLKQAIVDFKPDAVHFHTMGELSPSVLFALGGTPAILTVHGPEEYTKSILKWYLPPIAFRDSVDGHNLTLLGRIYYVFFKYMQRPLYAAGFKKLRFMISPSRYLADVVAQENLGVPIKHIYNGIELSAEQPLSSLHNILYVGRLEQVKGVEVLLRAIVAIIKRIPDAHLRIVGDGPDRPRLEALTHTLGIEKSVTFCGWLKGESVGDEYAATSLLVIPSLWPENQPTVAMEALAVGRPIIGSRVGGIPELIQNGKTGAIVEPGDIEALAAATISLLSAEDIAVKAHDAHISAEQFGLEQFITRIEAVYKEIKL